MEHYSIPLGRTFTQRNNRIGFGHEMKVIDRSQSIVADDSDAGLVTIAGTGSGKGVSQVIPTALTYPGSMIILDIKGEIASVTERARRSMGQRVVKLDPFGVGERDSLNPLELIDTSSPQAYDECCRLARCFYESSSDRDPFWDETASTILAGSILFFAKYIDQAQRSLSLLHRMWGASDHLAELLALMSLCEEEQGVIKAAAQLYIDAPDKTRGSIHTTLRNQISFLGSAGSQKSLDGGWGLLSDIEHCVPMTIYIRIPPQMLKSHGALLRIWLGTIIAVIAKRTIKPAIPDLLLVDEAATVGYLDELLTAASLLRGYGVKTWTFWQSIGQLESIYGKRAREFLDNAGALSMFGAGNAASARSIEDLTGFGGQILTLPADQFVLCQPGARARLMQKLNYLKDPEFKNRYDHNPYYSNEPKTPIHLQEVV